MFKLFHNPKVLVPIYYAFMPLPKYTSYENIP